MANTYKAAIAGCGGIFPMHARSLTAAGIPIAAVCDTVPERAEQQAKTYHCQPYTDYETMIKAGGFDVLHICLPHYLHAPAARYAAEHGLHVLTEKPMAITVADAESMITAARQNGVKLGVIFQNRYNPGSRLIKRVLDTGELGKIRSGWLRVTWYRDASYYASGDWRGYWATEGGGVVINQSIHTFDLMNYLLGGRPSYVDASAANRRHPSIEVEDMAEGIIAYGSGDIPISFYVNTYHPYDAPVMLEIIAERGRVTLTGEHAVVTYEDGRQETADRDEEAAAAVSGGLKDYWGVSHYKQISAFYASLAGGTEPEINGESALLTQRLICALYESAQTGKRVLL